MFEETIHLVPSTNKQKGTYIKMWKTTGDYKKFVVEINMLLNPTFQEMRIKGMFKGCNSVTYSNFKCNLLFDNSKYIEISNTTFDPNIDVFMDSFKRNERIRIKFHINGVSRLFKRKCDFSGNNTCKFENDVVQLHDDKLAKYFYTCFDFDVMDIWGASLIDYIKGYEVQFNCRFYHDSTKPLFDNVIQQNNFNFDKNIEIIEKTLEQLKKIRNICKQQNIHTCTKIYINDICKFYDFIDFLNT